ADLLKPRYNKDAIFLITFLPVGLMVLGALLHADAGSGRWVRHIVGIGRVSLFIVLGMHAYALGCFLNGVRVPDQTLHHIGIAVGVTWSVAWLRAARRVPDPESC
ncbi:MAG TPA: hypothetical protein VJV75_07170, partial [Candidatus Polarisedimenticolia bacterium]|nr:hypothetical protein [Candidatus Polarisedimenticolia bacterium]